MQRIKVKIKKKKMLFWTAVIMFFSLINPGFSQEENQQKIPGSGDRKNCHIPGTDAPGLL
jgi:hypothetical protein